MKPYVAYIGVVDKREQCHFVEFKTGLNVVTGKSSTGKSALIEIFDYCMGSSEYTIPVGRITESAAIYFTIYKKGNRFLVLGKLPKDKKGFYREVSEDELPLSSDGLTLTSSWFKLGYFVVADQYKKKIGAFFGLNINDIETDKDDKQFFGRKKSSPSIRSFTSFMLQHQNLIANKHAVFYRFDEKEKREQAIEHLKIFLGFVDQQYFLLKQELAELEKKKRRIELALPKKEKQLELKIIKLSKRLNEYQALSGKRLVDSSSADIIKNPIHWLDIIKDKPLEIDLESTSNTKLITELDKKIAGEVKVLRKLEKEARDIESTISISNSYFESISDINYPEKITESVIECPFCLTETNLLSSEADKLTNAINWLNEEITIQKPQQYDYRPRLESLKSELTTQRRHIKDIRVEKASLIASNRELEKRQNLRDQIVKAKVSIEIYLEEIISEGHIEQADGELEQLKTKISKLKGTLSQYSIVQKMRNAEMLLNETMNTIGQNLDFEEFYKNPLNLNFSLETFDIWLIAKKERVFLRSMGSGANWLYCHLSLFLSFQKLFCSLGQECSIPPVLFIDQPTQVYFPNVTNDTDESRFDVNKLASAERKNKVDEDIKSVENFFNEIISFCERTEVETGFKPQIIVTDHADELNLARGRNFEDYVRARWRNRGFIA
ncbi:MULTISPECIES: DUF3732 domain-containing protein [Pseudoalteromonas]|uniref:DUF3732 domain-containing protein n=1 Tax=Pseudoalteromonas TaxID=53246 RepID=UPI00057D3C0F|nr:DUF3732 domain-containing protein [Pseudoalteromonas flavipulchra]KID38840.1 hypothetical protein QT15_02710 [Pseudoalteromonas flavipulchra NCIMB 2033 = ATCC BAA-314]MBD0783604.1 DUF3732 domain-containing protein [Pseudoalteromonas flavipulchra]MBE0375076.1 hypothetical protein [Pseudoalteromonas flavipulchra NCIMB 2033 = ATCC BAA-314]